MSIKHIAQGYTNLIFKNKSVEEKYLIKKEICNSCPHGENGVTCLSKVKIVSKVTGQTIQSIGGCSCILSALLRSDKKCSRGRF